MNDYQITQAASPGSPTETMPPVAKQSPPHSRGEERVSVMYGDRLCTTCHYNLIGQPVLREGHYNLLVVRCPECATMASLQEYPQLGRWENRWAIFLSGVWIILLLAFAAGGLGMTFGMSGGFTGETVYHFQDELRSHWETWHKAAYPDVSITSRWRNPDDFDEWMKLHPPSTMLAELGGAKKMLARPELLLYTFPIFAAGVMGIFWSVALLHRRRLTMLGASIGLLLIAGGLFGTAWWQIAQQSINSFDEIAWIQLGMPLMATVLLICWGLFTFMLMFGRSIARRLVRVLLPPGLRRPLSVLWLADGLTPPLTLETRL